MLSSWIWPCALVGVFPRGKTFCVPGSSEKHGADPEGAGCSVSVPWIVPNLDRAAAGVGGKKVAQPLLGCGEG